MRQINRYIWPLGALVLGLGIGALGMWQAMQDARGMSSNQVTCRPTTPERAFAGTEKPVLLLWGNSLLFDNDWQSTSGAIVNCARQGQTAVAAVPRTALLPGPKPDAILVAFGSVEAFHASNGGRTLDIDAFRSAMTDILDDVSRRWPTADVIVTSTPAFSTIGTLRRADVATLNTELTAVASRIGAGYLDLSRVLQEHPTPSYDGVHVSPGAYALWEAEIRDMLIARAR